ncbi:MAG TPA: hypothetical protein VEP49_01990 [Acidimicrobiia bacterium]|nr:hypothetical protein [Acidimicrobiia bacterium]
MGRGDAGTSTTALFRAPAVPATIAKRAVELGRDDRVSLEEGAEHLVRLAKGRRLALELALVALDDQCGGPTVGRGHARMLLLAALDELARPVSSARV